MGVGGGGLIASQGLLEKRGAAYGRCLDLVPWSNGLRVSSSTEGGLSGGDWVCVYTLKKSFACLSTVKSIRYDECTFCISLHLTSCSLFLPKNYSLNFFRCFISAGQGLECL